VADPSLSPQEQAQYVFMDDFHPTTAVHDLVADLVAQSVTEATPGAVLSSSLDVVNHLIASSGWSSPLAWLDPLLSADTSGPAASLALVSSSPPMVLA
jgi:hypothetical protein